MIRGLYEFSALVNVICGEYEIGIEELHVIESKVVSVQQLHFGFTYFI